MLGCPILRVFAKDGNDKPHMALRTKVLSNEKKTDQAPFACIRLCLCSYCVFIRADPRRSAVGLFSTATSPLTNPESIPDPPPESHTPAIPSAESTAHH